MSAIHSKAAFFCESYCPYCYCNDLCLSCIFEGIWGDAFIFKRTDRMDLCPRLYGFIAMIFGGLLCDVIGMKRLSFLLLLVMLQGLIVYPAKMQPCYFVGTLCIGIGNGMVEAACNPLYGKYCSRQQNHHAKQVSRVVSRRYHNWWLISYLFLNNCILDWHILIATLFIPYCYLYFMFFKLQFHKQKE